MRIIVAGGKTGGHIFPALSVIKEMRKLEKNVSVFFIGSGSKIEKMLLEEEPLVYEKIEVYPIMGMGIKALKSIFYLPLSLFDALEKVKRIKPHCILGMGGYSSGPIIIAGWLKGIPTFIHEQNYEPGFTNKILKNFVKKVFYSFRESGKFFGKKGIYSGNPVRKEFFEIQREKSEFFTVLVFGGSQGSSVLNNAFLKALPELKKKIEKLRVFHSSGERDYEKVLQEYKKFDFIWEVKPFFNDIWNYFAKADLLVSRAGASTIFEILSAAKASILVPFAKSAGSHQLKNAMELKNKGVAEIILEKELSGETLANKIIDLYQYREKIEEMEKKAKNLVEREASLTIAKTILKEIKENV